MPTVATSLDGASTTARASPRSTEAGMSSSRSPSPTKNMGTGRSSSRPVPSTSICFDRPSVSSPCNSPAAAAPRRRNRTQRRPLRSLQPWPSPATRPRPRAHRSLVRRTLSPRPRPARPVGSSQLRYPHRSRWPVLREGMGRANVHLIEPGDDPYSLRGDGKPTGLERDRVRARQSLQRQRAGRRHRGPGAQTRLLDVLTGTWVSSRPGRGLRRVPGRPCAQRPRSCTARPGCPRR